MTLYCCVVFHCSYHSPCVSSSVDENLDCSSIGPTVNKGAINILVFGYMLLFPCGNYLGVEWVGHTYRCFNFRYCQASSKMMILFYIPTSSVWKSVIACFCQPLVWTVFSVLDIIVGHHALITDAEHHPMCFTDVCRIAHLKMLSGFLIIQLHKFIICSGYKSFIK